MDKLIFKIRNDKTSEGELFNKKQNENKESVVKNIKETKNSSVFYTKNDILNISEPKNIKRLHKTYTNKKYICLIEDLKKLNEKCIKLHEIKNSTKRVITEGFYTIVEVDVSYGNFSKLFLFDQTKTIFGFTNIQGIKPGDIISLKNCGIWNDPDKSLIILKENVKKVIKNKK
ncbi:hypothetical protein EHP00_926 [Ecytonucleospora hepatopenaei]|uniref:Uncharacterized protein n=1 Tax=Ecytonucleospora hepatopenaei TaxID=646526 RepID=A0A1W0E4Q8_9MICR|nr:hypothetical protein EHP00_926 [Ecytonucleospora hepatopenaei]